MSSLSLDCRIDVVVGCICMWVGALFFLVVLLGCGARHFVHAFVQRQDHCRASVGLFRFCCDFIVRGL